MGDPRKWEPVNVPLRKAQAAVGKAADSAERPAATFGKAWIIPCKRGEQKDRLTLRDNPITQFRPLFIGPRLMQSSVEIEVPFGSPNRPVTLLGQYELLTAELQWKCPQDQGWSGVKNTNSIRWNNVAGTLAGGRLRQRSYKPPSVLNGRYFYTDGHTFSLDPVHPDGTLTPLLAKAKRAGLAANPFTCALKVRKTFEARTHLYDSTETKLLDCRAWGYDFSASYDPSSNPPAVTGSHRYTGVP